MWQTSGVAEDWLKSAEHRNRAFRAATERMFASAKIHEGDRVLDLGAGTGDTSFLIARIVGPGGSVVAADVAPGMVEAIATMARSTGQANVTARVMDSDAINLEADRFDAVVARNSLMFVRDLEASLAQIHRVLRPGGQFSAIVWGPLAENPYNRIPIEIVRDLHRMPAKTPELVTAFSLDDADRWARSLASVGFREVVVDRVSLTRDFPSLADALAQPRTSPIWAELFSGVPLPERETLFGRLEAAYREFESPKGCAFPALSLVPAGTKAGTVS
jgi:ubiquinone/menaquinone biosynthesis C-methylase UbiE